MSVDDETRATFASFFTRPALRIHPAFAPPSHSPPAHLTRELSVDSTASSISSVSNTNSPNTSSTRSLSDDEGLRNVTSRLARSSLLERGEADAFLNLTEDTTVVVDASQSRPTRASTIPSATRRVQLYTKQIKRTLRVSQSNKITKYLQKVPSGEPRYPVAAQLLRSADNPHAHLAASIKIADFARTKSTVTRTKRKSPELDRARAVPTYGTRAIPTFFREPSEPDSGQKLISISPSLPPSSVMDCDFDTTLLISAAPVVTADLEDEAVHHTSPTQDDTHFRRHNSAHIRTPSPSSSARSFRPYTESHRPEGRKDRLMRPPTAVSFITCGMPASPDSIRLLTALNRGNGLAGLAAFNGQDINPFL
ncbi:hypothetical protein HKX48_005016 [Thoreauomyces humboldtii]|nr:hypothetical protein HKX48_005016 [Thoreauomyces humboldtii]